MFFHATIVNSHQSVTFLAFSCLKDVKVCLLYCASCACCVYVYECNLLEIQTSCIFNRCNVV